MARRSPNSCGCGTLSWKWAILLVLIVIVIGAFMSSCAKQQIVRKPTFFKEGIASWYGPGFHGRRTANGERYNQNALTAAHKSLPFDTKVRVINLTNDKEVIVRINDRGPFVRGRIIDLSKKAARQIAMLGSGTARVRIETIEPKKEATDEHVRISDRREPRRGHKRIP